MTGSLKQQTLRGTLWSSIERFSVQGVQFLILILMARILSPDDYGMVGMLAIFLAVAQSLIDSGFSNALIQKVHCSETDYSTVFWFNIVVGLLLYGLLWVCAPFIAEFYRLPLLTEITRVIAWVLFFNSLTVVPRALLSSRIDFRTQAKASIVAAVVAGVVGVVGAYGGWGVWSIVAYTLCNSVINAALLWLFLRWKPRWIFSGASFQQLFSFGSKLMVSGVIDTLYKNLYTLVIGRRFAATDLGYYTRADQFAQFPSSNLTGILQRVTYPVLCNIQDEDERLRGAYRKFLRLSAFVIFPLMVGLSVLATPLVTVVLGPQWEPAGELLTLLALCGMWYPIHAINLNLLQVKGRSDLFLKLEIIKKLIGIGILCLTVPLGIKAMCIGSIVSSLLGLVVNTYYTQKLISLGFIRQMRDLMPTLVYVATMGLVVWIVAGCFESNVWKLIAGIMVGCVWYILISSLTRSSDWKEIIAIIQRKHNN